VLSTLLLFGCTAAVIVVAGSLLTRFADRIAGLTGLGHTLLGLGLLALASPELRGFSSQLHRPGLETANWAAEKPCWLRFCTPRINSDVASRHSARQRVLGYAKESASNPNQQSGSVR
jgi:hypothetical protein